MGRAAKKQTKAKPKKQTRRERSVANKKAFADVMAEEAAKLLTPVKVSRGTSTYSEELVSQVIEKVSSGDTLRGACRQLGLNEATFRYWVNEDKGADPDQNPPVPGLASRYARARELQAEAWADSIVELADSARDEVNIQQTRLRIDTRKWLMGKNHIRFSEKTTVALEGGDASKPIRTIDETMSPKEASEIYAQMIRKSES